MRNPDLYGPARDALAAMLAYQHSTPDFDKAIADLRAALAPVPTPAQLRAAGDIEGADSAAESLIYETAGRIVGEDVKLCVSWLVSELFKRAGERASIMEDDERDALTGRGPDADDLRDELPGDYVCEAGIDPSDGARAWRWYLKDDGAPDPADSEWFDEEEEALRDLYESERLDMPDGCEALEHWAVSRWLAEKLKAKGESVIETDWAGHVWARCTSGQMIRMDSVIREIARDLCAKELEGVDA